MVTVSAAQAQTATFDLQASSFTTGGFNPVSMVVADVNGDGKPDALVTNLNSVMGVLLNTTTFLPTRAALPSASASLYPNPAHAAATLAVAGLPATATQVQAALLDATGRAVGRPVLTVGQGQGRAQVPLAGLAAGFYVVRLQAHDAQGGLLGELPAQRLSVE